MERLTRWNDQTESAELTAYDDFDWKQFWNKELLDVVDFIRLREAFDKLAEYEDLEEQLGKVYGEHEGLLEMVVKSLVKHNGEKPRKSRLLTDEDADRWEEYKKLEEQGLLLKLPIKVCGEVWRISTQHDNYDESPYKIVSRTTFRLDMLNCIGKTVFLTKEEAEAALKEMEEK